MIFIEVFNIVTPKLTVMILKAGRSQCEAIVISCTQET